MQRLLNGGLALTPERYSLRPANRRWVLFAAISMLLSFVCDGWSGKPTAFYHQLLLLPAGAGYVYLLGSLLRGKGSQEGQTGGAARELPSGWWMVLVAFELGAVCLIVVESRHYRTFGYHITAGVAGLAVSVAVLGWAWFFHARTSAGLFGAIVLSYLAGFGIALLDFPLNYLRSDMLPVISWADQRIVAHQNAYATMHIGARLYDFPYLPGMLVAYWPAAVLHVDPRFASLVYLLLAALLIWWSALPERRFEVATLVGLFLLCPFLQYRHELYLQPHWFLLVGAIVLMRQRRFLGAAFVWGVGCAVYQFSWILLPFVLLNAYRRRGLMEAVKLLAAACLGALIVAGPFLSSAWRKIGSNTVGQWSRLPHALADPINASYWLTYLVRPDQLKWVQAVFLVGLFSFCFWRGRCASLTDTLRFMCIALGVFIPLNVIVDGYFYLTLLLLLLLYACVANEWWREPGAAVEPKTDSRMDGSGSLAPS